MGVRSQMSAVEVIVNRRTLVLADEDEAIVMGVTLHLRQAGFQVRREREAGDAIHGGPAFGIK